MENLLDHEIEKLIDLWRSQENLYNINLASYSDRNKARESYIYIGVQMAKGWDVDKTKNRLKNLRSSYTRNLGLVQRSQKSGASAADIYVCRWKWYAVLDNFLRPYVKVISQSVSNLTFSQTAEPAVADSQPIEEEDDSQVDLPSCSFRRRELTGDEEIVRLIETGTARTIRASTSATQSPTSTPSTSPTPWYATQSTSSAPQKRLRTSSAPQPNNLSVSPSPSPSPTDPASLQAPDFGRQERKRKRSDSSSPCGTGSPLSEMVGHMREKQADRMRRDEDDRRWREEERNRRAEERQKAEERKSREETENGKFCQYAALQLDKLCASFQNKARKEIMDVLFKYSEKEEENNK